MREIILHSVHMVDGDRSLQKTVDARSWRADHEDLFREAGALRISCTYRGCTVQGTKRSTDIFLHKDTFSSAHTKQKKQPQANNRANIKDVRCNSTSLLGKLSQGS